VNEFLTVLGFSLMVMTPPRICTTIDCENSAMGQRLHSPLFDVSALTTTSKETNTKVTQRIGMKLSRREDKDASSISLQIRPKSTASTADQGVDRESSRTESSLYMEADMKAGATTMPTVVRTREAEAPLVLVE
jgi:hypothetical protein